MSDDLIERLRTITSSGCNPYSACHEAAAELSRLRAEVERLTRKLDGEWNAAIMEAAGIASNACLVPPDGGSPTEAEVAVCDTAYQRILTLIRIRRKATP